MLLTGFQEVQRQGISVFFLGKTFAVQCNVTVIVHLVHIYVCSKSNSKVARQLYTLPTIWAYGLSPCALFSTYMYLLTALQRAHGLKQAALVLCMHANAHCSKVKMNGKKLSKFQFHFPGLLGTSPMSKQEFFFSSIINKGVTRDNSIYQFGNQMNRTQTNFTITRYGHFPTKVF